MYLLFVFSLIIVGELLFFLVLCIRFLDKLCVYFVVEIVFGEDMEDFKSGLFF